MQIIPQKPVLSQLCLIDNNPYLVDFLKFMLVKNQTYRPNIDTVIKRFEHVYALLEGGTGAMIQKRDFDMLQYDNKIYNESYFENSIENCEDMINNEDNALHYIVRVFDVENNPQAYFLKQELNVE